MAAHGKREKHVDIKRTPRWRRILKKTAVAVGGLVLSAALIGFVVQYRRDAAFLSEHPAPGSFATVDGLQIHFRTSGAGDVTFVLEAGLGDYSGSWRTLETSLAGIGRVFVYDRAGLGWSEESPRPRTAPQITLELHRLLEEAHVPQPYLLVGHSSGGITQTLYAMDYPDEVAGLLLIDPSHKDQFTKLPGPPALLGLVMTQISRTASFGLPQLVMGSSDPVVNQARHVRTSGAELRAVLNVAETWGNRSIDLGTTPIYVLSGDASDQFPGTSAAEKKAILEIWQSLHADLVAASSSEIRKHEIVPGAAHYIYHTHPAVVIDAAREMLDRLKSGSRQARPRN